MYQDSSQCFMINNTRGVARAVIQTPNCFLPTVHFWATFDYVEYLGEYWSLLGAFWPVFDLFWPDLDHCGPYWITFDRFPQKSLEIRSFVALFSKHLRFFFCQRPKFLW